MSRPYSGSRVRGSVLLAAVRATADSRSRTLATDWVEKVNTTAQEHVAEPVEAAGILQPAGTWGAFGVEQLSPAVAMFKRRKVNKDAGGLAKSSWKGTKTALLAV